MPVHDPEEEQEFSRPLPEETDDAPVGLSLADYLEQQGQFDDATPEYVQKEPGRPEKEAESLKDSFDSRRDPNRVTGPESVQPTARVGNEQLAGRIAPQPNPANARMDTLSGTGGAAGKAGGQAAKGAAAGAIGKAGKAVSGAADSAEVGHLVSGVTDKLADKLAGNADPNSLRGKLARKLAEKGKDAGDIIDLLETGGLDIRRWWSLLSRRWKWVLYPGAASALGALILGLGMAAFFWSQRGDNAGTIGLPATSPYALSVANPDGLYLDIMSPSYNVVDPKTKKTRYTLTVEATSGGFSRERDAVRATSANASGVTGDNGQPIIGRACLRENNQWLSDNGKAGVDCIAGGSIYTIATGESRAMTDDELKWYVTGRWPYVKTYWWDQKYNAKPKTVLNPAQPKKFFMGRKVVLYNPATNRAVVGLVSEWGPAPWTGIDKPNVTSQRNYWENGPSGPEPRVQVPQDYLGRVAGGGSAIREYLGADSDTPIILGFLKQELESTTPVGPITAFRVMRLGSDATAAVAGRVPLLKQGEYRNVPYTATGNSAQTVASSGCGIVSAAMVLGYYGKTVSIPELAQWSVANGYRTANSGTSHGFFPAIARREGLSSRELTGKWNEIMELLKQRIPVIVSGKGRGGAGSDPRPFTFGGHYVVLTGITSDGRITVNDPAGRRGGNRDNQAYSEETIKSQYHYAVAILK